LPVVNGRVDGKARFAIYTNYSMFVEKYEVVIYRGDDGDRAAPLAVVPVRFLPHTLRNPLFHWTHLELKRYFGIDDLLNEQTAPAIWEKTQEMLAQKDMSARGILKKFQVRALCTTDDPIDDLAHHQKCAADGFEVGVYPTFRPDKALAVHAPEAWNAWCDKLSAASGIDVKNYATLLEALTQRHDFFHSVGGRLSDHGLNYCHANFVSDAEAERIFAAWQSDASSRDAALRAVLTRLPVGEA
jgi:glucuronate isomerase